MTRHTWGRKGPQTETSRDLVLQALGELHVCVLLGSRQASVAPGQGSGAMRSGFTSPVFPAGTEDCDDVQQHQAQAVRMSSVCLFPETAAHHCGAFVTKSTSKSRP